MMTAGKLPGAVRNWSKRPTTESFSWFDGTGIPQQRLRPVDPEPVLRVAPAPASVPEPVPALAPEAAAVRAGRPVWTESRIRTGVLVLLCLLAVVILRGGVGVGSGSEAGAGNWSLVSTSMIQTLTASEGVTGASGGYLPGVGLVFYAELSSVAREALGPWLLALISPMSARLADLPDREALVWHLEVTGSETYSQLIRVPGDAVTTPTAWSESSGAPLAVPEVTATGTAPPAATASAPAATGSPAATSAAPAATASAAPAASTAASASATAAAAGGAVTEDFAAGADRWTTLTGAWQVTDGVYRQTDASGFDLISQLTAAVPATYDIQVKMRAAGEKLGAGLLIGQPQKGTRNGATLIDVTDGSYLRWGTYSAGGTYSFVGGNGLPGTAVKGAWHVLKVSVQEDKTVIFWDDKNIGEIKAVPKGGVGLVTSAAATDFDDFTVKAR